MHLNVFVIIHLYKWLFVCVSNLIYLSSSCICWTKLRLTLCYFHHRVESNLKNSLPPAHSQENHRVQTPRLSVEPTIWTRWCFIISTADFSSNDKWKINVCILVTQDEHCNDLLPVQRYQLSRILFHNTCCFHNMSAPSCAVSSNTAEVPRKQRQNRKKINQNKK